MNKVWLQLTVWKFHVQNDEISSKAASDCYSNSDNMEYWALEVSM